MESTTQAVRTPIEPFAVRTIGVVRARHPTHPSFVRVPRRFVAGEMEMDRGSVGRSTVASKKSGRAGRKPMVTIAEGRPDVAGSVVSFAGAGVGAGASSVSVSKSFSGGNVPVYTPPVMSDAGCGCTSATLLTMTHPCVIPICTLLRSLGRANTSRVLH